MPVSIFVAVIVCAKWLGGSDSEVGARLDRNPPPPAKKEEESVR